MLPGEITIKNADGQI